MRHVYLPPIDVVRFICIRTIHYGWRMHDLVIRNATLIDGTGDERRLADIAVDGEHITAVRQPDAATGDTERISSGRREIDADGLLVTPGWVDIHTHYDGQVTWDPDVAPSSVNGVTSILLGNCGVGFAPVRPDQHQFLIELLEGVLRQAHDCQQPLRVVLFGNRFEDIHRQGMHLRAGFAALLDQRAGEQAVQALGGVVERVGLCAGFERLADRMDAFDDKPTGRFSLLALAERPDEFHFWIAVAADQFHLIRGAAPTPARWCLRPPR